MEKPADLFQEFVDLNGMKTNDSSGPEPNYRAYLRLRMSYRKMRLQEYLQPETTRTIDAKLVNVNAYLRGSTRYSHSIFI
jgi:hypothetical protein